MLKTELIFQKEATESTVFVNFPQDTHFFLAFPIEFHINKYIDYKGH